MTRRSALLALIGCGAGFLIGGCTDGSVAASTPRIDTSGNETPTMSHTPPVTEQLPKTTPWQASAADIAPAIKTRAARLVEAVAAWPLGQEHLGAAMQRASHSGFEPGVTTDLAPLLAQEPAAAIQVVNAQYGGLLESSASVLLVVKQWIVDGDGLVHRNDTSLDVRLAVDDPRWTVTTVRPANPGPPNPSPSTNAGQLLANERVRLPAAARADVRSGAISESVIHALNELSRDHVLDVSVLRSGHPIRVFGTGRRSNHTDGRAFDVFAIDGRLVVEPSNRDAVVNVMRAAASVGAYQVGGPVDLDGVATKYFSDATHHDHIHVGFAS